MGKEIIIFDNIQIGKQNFTAAKTQSQYMI